MCAREKSFGFVDNTQERTSFSVLPTQSQILAASQFEYSQDQCKENLELKLKTLNFVVLTQKAAASNNFSISFWPMGPGKVIRDGSMMVLLFFTIGFNAHTNFVSLLTRHRNVDR